MAAWKAGSDFVKVFPCSLLEGPSCIRTLKLPFPDIPLIASGGVTQQTATDFILAGAVAVGIGRDLVYPEAVRRRERDWIRELGGGSCRSSRMRAANRRRETGRVTFMLKILVLIGIGASYLLMADDAPIVQVQTTHTERMDFPSGGVLHMTKSTGDLTVEGWDRPDVEITTIKSTKSYHPRDRTAAAKSLDRIRLVPERQGDDSRSRPSFQA